MIVPVVTPPVLLMYAVREGAAYLLEVLVQAVVTAVLQIYVMVEYVKPHQI